MYMYIHADYMCTCTCTCMYMYAWLSYHRDTVTRDLTPSLQQGVGFGKYKGWTKINVFPSYCKMARLAVLLMEQISLIN